MSYVDSLQKSTETSQRQWICSPLGCAMFHWFNFLISFTPFFFPYVTFLKNQLTLSHSFTAIHFLFYPPTASVCWSATWLGVCSVSSVSTEELHKDWGARLMNQWMSDAIEAHDM